MLKKGDTKLKKHPHLTISMLEKKKCPAVILQLMQILYKSVTLRSAQTHVSLHPLTSMASLMKKIGVLLPVRSQLPSSV